MLRRFVTTLLAVVVSALLFVAPSQARSLDDIIKEGTIRIGVNPNFPPMSSYGATNQFEGFDIDVGNMLAEAIGVKAEFVPTETPQRVPFLVSDRIDISLGALTRTAARAKLIDFTVPLHTEAMAVLTTDKVNETGWKAFDKDKYTLVNIRGTWPVDFLKKELPNAKMLLVDSIADTVRSVAQGRADAIIENIDFFMAHTKNFPDVKWKVLPETVFVGYCAIGVSKGNDSLRQFLNIKLYDLHSAGTINEKWQEWYGAPMLKPVVANPFF